MRTRFPCGSLPSRLASARRAAAVLAMWAASASFAGLPDTAARWTSPEQTFRLALEAQSEGDFPAMLRLLRRAASQGSVEAQELLGMALLVGPTLYGSGVRTDRCEAGLWLRKATAQGSEVAKMQLEFLNRLRQSPSGRDVCQAWGG